MKTKEEWRFIPGHPMYEVSNMGRVRSWRLKGTTHGRMKEPRLMKTTCGNRGYPKVLFTYKGKKLYKNVHRLVLLAFVGPSDLWCNHKNGIKSDSRLSNLEYCTRQENIDHAYRLRLIPILKGEQQGGSKLNEKQVIRIYKSNKSRKELAKEYAVSISTISSIKNQKSWRHLWT